MGAVTKLLETPSRAPPAPTHCCNLVYVQLAGQVLDLLQHTLHLSLPCMADGLGLRLGSFWWLRPLVDHKGRSCSV